MQLYKKIKEQIIDFSQKIYDTNIFNPNINEYSNKLIKLKDKNGYVVNLYIFSSKILIETSLKTTLLFSINIKDVVCFSNLFLMEITDIGKLYTNNLHNDNIIKCIIAIQEDLKVLNLSYDEGVIVYNNALQVIINFEKEINYLLKIIKMIKNKIEIACPEQVGSKNKNTMPQKFQTIINNYSDWIISDDLEREIKIKESNKTELEHLINSISPKLPTINKYIDSFGVKTLPEEVIKLQNLAELVNELML
ncbi:MAG: hypothetical protein LBK94_09350 [Prevotellaceae bacterium]|jgi:hypothetical protein|nr:hypothetical protein [Prevotellaceae bacterium]